MLATQLQTLKKALNSGLIDDDEAHELIDSLHFDYIRSDILRWGKYYFPDKFTLPFCDELHRYFIDIADEAYTSTLAPRGHAKTTIKCFLIPIYFALNYPDKYYHYLNIQATSTKAISINRAIRHELETNELLIRDYELQVSDQKWTEKQFVLRNGVIFTAIGAGDSVRGINLNNKRPDYVIIDDLYDESSIENPWQIDKINRWYYGAIYKCVANNKATCIHIQGTAINRNDLMHQLQNKDYCKSKTFKACDFKSGDVLWSSVNTLESLSRDREEMGTIIFSREMLNEVRDDETSIIKLRDIHRYTSISSDEKVVERILSVDPAAGTKTVNDATGWCVAYKTNFDNYYIVDVGNDRITINDSIQLMQKLHAKHQFTSVKIEAIAGFKLLVQEARRRTNLSIKEVSNVKDKITRLISVSPKFENGKVLISSSISDKLSRELIQQLVNNHPPHDDMREAVIMSIEDDKRPFIVV